MKILMIGLGSIGQRHLRNIRRLYGDSHEILAYRVRRLKQTFSDDMKVCDGVDLEEEFNIKVFSSLDIALEEKPDIVFITNITAAHMECALKVARAGCDLFIEKPISDSLAGCSDFAETVRNRGNVVYVGYQNRFHPCVMKIKNIIEKGEIGRLISVDNEFGEQLASMHMYEDYRTTYMARREMGGGPILNLQIHCLDYLQWIFGIPEAVFTVAGKSSGLDIDVEDYASSIYFFQQENGMAFPVYSHTDFLQHPSSHKLKVVGETGWIETDLNEASIRIYIDGQKSQTINYRDFRRNDMFVKELQVFMDCVKQRKRSESDLEQGIIGLKMALAAKKSAKEKRVVYLEEL